MKKMFEFSVKTKEKFDEMTALIDENCEKIQVMTNKQELAQHINKLQKKLDNFVDKDEY